MQRTALPSGNLRSLSELKKRIFFLIGALLVYRIGAQIPVPGLDPARLAELFSGNRGILELFNLFSGGALARLSLFALGIMPYISASIIIQLLTVVWPTLEQLKKEGQVGRKKISQYTRYSTLALATLQAVGMARYLANSGIALDPNLTYYFIVTLTLVSGTMFLMWLGEQITERGVGNGISMIIFAGIVSGLPSAVIGTLEKVSQGEMQAIGLVLLCVMLMAIIAFVVFIERGQRRITVNYAQRQQGRKMYAAQKSHLPLKLNMAGVIPPIFASSFILFPATIAQWFGKTPGFEWLTALSLALSPGQPCYILLFAAAIIFFCFFYTALVFNPKETAENLKKSGGYIPGIRPGDQTAQYIDKVMTRLTIVGAIYITLVSLLPEFLVMGWNVPFYFGGTSLLIIVVVVMDFMAQVQAHLMSHQYESLMKKANLKGSR
ncbi:MAG TPA: preprotein translocase subunit SecY [Gammaproteobacteria bacterium]|nr:preprotein translocase subunit SecY [Gammaproteobacteria bacterium]HRA42515.1 preprotein translocase subunit SecY [Gammaproteobacteria bacterium]